MRIFASFILLIGLYLCITTITFPWAVEAKLAPFVGKATPDLMSEIYNSVALLLIAQLVAGICSVIAAILLFKNNKNGATLWLLTCLLFFVASGYDAYTKTPDLGMSISISIFGIFVIWVSFRIFRYCGLYPNPSFKRDTLKRAP